MSVDSPSGRVVGGFRIVELLARGAMGAVYLAEDREGQRVALKLLSPELAHDERFRQRLLRESRLAATLDHPNVVRTIASGEDSGVLYLVMEYVNGTDLRKLLRREGRLDPRRATELVRQAGEALDTAHRAGLVHRDVKPGNILVEHTPEGERAYVCDFGLARHVSSVGSLTGDRGFVGTVDYVAPEQIRGGSVDGRADIYALGCVLFECIAGERPHERDSELAVVFAHLNEPPPRLTDVRPELPTALDHVIGTAMAKSPRDRYRTAGELYRAADAAIKGAPAPPRARRRTGLLVGAAGFLAALAAVAALAVVLVTRDDSAQTPPQITAASIAGATLGLTNDDYKALFGVGWREEIFEGPNYPTLRYFSRKVAIYFESPGGPAVAITTWNRDFRTAAGIGPCSSIDDLKNAYGNALQPSPENTIDGKAYAYVVGHLIFGANGKPPHPSTHVTAVGIYSGITLGFAAYVLLSEPSCEDL
jgi:tRNA A-37 threonylcarbamoyl transferase component Bud32